MASFVFSSSTTQPPMAVTDFFVDLGNLLRWDPTVTRVERLFEGEPGVGSRFAVDIDTGSTKLSFVYEIVELEPGRLVRARAEDSRFISDDLVEVAVEDGATSYRYTARLEGKGLWKLADPLLAASLGKIGKRASAGLVAALG